MKPFELLPVYHETLYAIPLKSKEVLKKVGNFERKVLAVVNLSDWNGANEILLEKILNSCGLNSNDYLIVIITKEANVFEIINQYLPHYLFLFDVNLESDFFTSNKQLYKPFSLNKVKMVLADSLHVLSDDKGKRLLLWNEAIKPLFKIK